jgi:hypothetical protein
MKKVCYLLLLLNCWLFNNAVFAQNGVALGCDTMVITCQAANAADPVLAVMNIGAIAGSPVNTNYAFPAVTARHQVGTTQFNRLNLGQVFGLAYNTTGDILTSATSIYNGVDAWGIINNAALPIAGSTPVFPGGQVPNSGSVYKITGTGISEMVELPNKGQGLGNLCFDKLHNLTFVTNFYDGQIYRVDNTGKYTAFDPTFGNNATVYGAAVTDLARLGQRPWGIAVFGTTVNNMKLYYARWSNSTSTNTGVQNQIWSVDLDAAGNIISSTEVKIYDIPYLFGYNASEPVADIEISTDGTRMLLAERTMYGAALQTNAHASRLLEITKTGIVWAASTNTYTSGLGSATNCTGGADFGDAQINTDLKKCNGSVLSVNDYMMVAGGFLAYGVQINTGIGANTTANGKEIDLNNVSGTGDKTTLGDVDYRRCLDCPAPADLCGNFSTGEVDSICCRACLRQLQPLPSGAIVTSVGYTVIGGVIQGFTSGCVLNNPTNYAGTATGTVTFIGACSNFGSLCANLVSTTSSGNVTVNWVVTFVNPGTGQQQQCTYQSSVRNCPHPVTKCDDIKFLQGNCAGGALCFVDFTITNQMVPNDPICKIKIEKFDIYGNLQTSFWSTGYAITPLLGAPLYASPWNLIPSTGTLVTPTGGTVHFQNYFPAPGPMPGFVKVTVIHCNGDSSCTAIYKPRPLPPIDSYESAAMINVRPKFPRMFGTGYRLIANAQTGRGLENIPVKYVSVGVVTAAAGTMPEIVAVTGAEAYAERDAVQTSSIALHISRASHGKQNAFFEFNDPITIARGDTSEYLHIIYANAAPTTVAYTLYGTDGGIIRVDTARVETTNTTGISVVGNTNSGGEIFLINGSPNPTTGSYVVRYVNSSTQNLTFNLYDATGKLALRQTVTNIEAGMHDLPFDLSGLTNGLYLIRLTSDDGKSATEPLKVVLMR